MTNMKNVTMSELAGGLSEVLARVQAGSEIVITRRGVPIALLTPIEHGHAQGNEEPGVRERSASYATSPARTTALTGLFATPAMRAVMSVYLRDATLALHQREVARRAGIGLRSAQLALGKLVRIGVLQSERDGNRLYYRAVRTERFDDLQRLMAPELGVVEIIARHLAQAAKPVVRAFIFGSLASSQDTLASDIDLLVVSDASADELVQPIAAAQRELGREIDLVHYRVDEYARRRRNKNHFVEAILAQPRIDIVGRDDA